MQINSFTNHFWSQKLIKQKPSTDWFRAPRHCRGWLNCSPKVNDCSAAGNVTFFCGDRLTTHNFWFVSKDHSQTGIQFNFAMNFNPFRSHTKGKWNDIVDTVVWTMISDLYNESSALVFLWMTFCQQSLNANVKEYVCLYRISLQTPSLTLFVNKDGKLQNGSFLTNKNHLNGFHLFQIAINRWKQLCDFVRSKATSSKVWSKVRPKVKLWSFAGRFTWSKVWLKSSWHKFWKALVDERNTVRKKKIRTFEDFLEWPCLVIERICRLLYCSLGFLRVWF